MAKLKSVGNKGKDVKEKNYSNHQLQKEKDDVAKTSVKSSKGLMENLYNLDISLSESFSFCAAKDSGYWRTLMLILELSGHGVPWIAGTIISILVFSDSKQEFACNLFLSLILDLAVVGNLKVFVRRKRPTYNEEDMIATVSPDKYSFPSGHSTRAAMVASLFSVFLTTRFWTFLIGCWAVCVSSSRVILGRHHVSDVLCGVLIGLLQGWVICAIWVPYTTCLETLSCIPYYSVIRNHVIHVVQ